MSARKSPKRPKKAVGYRSVPPTMPTEFWRNRHAVVEWMDHMEDVTRWAMANPEVRMAKIVKVAPPRRRLLVPTDPLVLTKNRILGADGRPLAAPR